MEEELPVTPAAEALRALEESVRDCHRCGLCQNRTQVVFGVGSPEAELMFVGEGPGFHEDRLGEPFVGQAGKLLNELLGGIGLSRADVYIANVVKCRPPENRDPLPDEIEACSPHLLDQVAIIRPRVICTLGRFATKLLSGSELSITAIHGKAKAKELGGVDTIIFPVFHPAAALYTPANRQVLVDDFAKLRRLLARGAEALTGAAAGLDDAAGAAQVARRADEDAPTANLPGEGDLPAGPSYSPGGGDSSGPKVPRPAEPAPTRTEQLHLW
jgi:DNA polymerase